MSNCLIFGASGQDGSFACEQLAENGFSVVGAVRKASTTNLSNLQSLISYKKNFRVERFDLHDESSIYRLLTEYKPEYIFNFADQDHVSWSHSLPLYSCDVTARSVNLLLEAIKLITPEATFVQPISSNIYGNSSISMITESTTIDPLSPYAIAKATALYICRYYRNAHSLKVVNPILFNHESERRTNDYVSRKISQAAAQIKLNRQSVLKLGDISSEIDWGYAPEFVDYMIQLAFGHHHDEFLIGSGTLMSVRRFAEYCFSTLDLNLDDYLEIDQSLIRPTKNNPLMADTSKIRGILDFSPKIYGKILAETLVNYDLKSLS
jgi:GDPmannose 4,6-dehydratase